jgi:hypothetical protein
MGSEKLRPVSRYWNDLKAEFPSDGLGRIYKLMVREKSEGESEWTFDKIVFYALLPKM